MRELRAPIAVVSALAVAAALVHLGRRSRQADESTKDVWDKTKLVAAEYNFVSGLIPFYRRMELTAVGGAGLVGTAIIGTLGALESTSPEMMKRDSIERTEELILAAAPWLFLLTTFLVLTALVRIRRASVYIQSDLAPLAPDVFQWETVLHSRLHSGAPLPIRLIMLLGEASLPVIFATTAPAIAFAVMADLWVPGEKSSTILALGYAGAASTLTVGLLASVFTVYHEVWARR